jgi:hypothetical protein
VEAADLVHDFGKLFAAAIKGARKATATAALHAIATKEEEVADFAVLNALVELLHVAAMARHETDADFEVLLHGFFGQGEHAAGTWAVARERLFHENVDAFFDSVLEVDPAEGERSGEDGHIAFAESVDGVFEGVEAEEFVVVHFNVAADLGVAFEAGESGVEFVLEDVSHGDEFGAAFLDGESVFGGAATASAAADQGDFDLVAPLGVNSRESDTGES